MPRYRLSEAYQTFVIRRAPFTPIFSQLATILAQAPAPGGMFHP
jgi:hypothetical protein